MNTDKDYNEDRGYITHAYINDERIIPSDSFEIEDNEYLLLEIIRSTDDVLFLKLLCIEGPSIGEHYLIPKHLFEEKTLLEIEASLEAYKH